MNFALSATIILLLGTFANYVIVRVENGYLRKRIDQISAEKTVAIQSVESRLKESSDGYVSCSKSKTTCEKDLKSALAKKEEDSKELEDLTKRVKDLDEEIDKLTSETETMETNIKTLTKEKNAAEVELKSCKDDKEILGKMLKTKQNKKGKVPVSRPHKKRPSSKLEKDEIDEYHVIVKEDDSVVNAKSVKTPKRRPTSKLEKDDNKDGDYYEGYDEDYDDYYGSKGKKRPSSKLKREKIDETKDIDNEEADLDNAKSGKTNKNYESHGNVKASKKKPSLNLENDEIDEAKDIDDEENLLHVTKAMSEQEIKNAELPDVDPNAVKVLNRDQKGIKTHKDKNGNQVPVLPKDDPKTTRAKAKHSVMDVKH